MPCGSTVLLYVSGSAHQQRQLPYAELMCGLLSSNVLHVVVSITSTAHSPSTAANSRSKMVASNHTSRSSARSYCSTQRRYWRQLARRIEMYAVPVWTGVLIRAS
jgi:hypothetical protein